MQVLSCFRAIFLPACTSLAELRSSKLYAPRLRRPVPLTLMFWSPRRVLHTLVRGLSVIYEVLVLTHCIPQRILLTGTFMPRNSIVSNRKYFMCPTLETDLDTFNHSDLTSVVQQVNTATMSWQTGWIEAAAQIGLPRKTVPTANLESDSCSSPHPLAIMTRLRLNSLHLRPVAPQLTIPTLHQRHTHSMQLNLNFRPESHACAHTLCKKEIHAFQFP